MWNKFVDLENDRFGFKTILHSIIGLAIFIVTNILSSIISQGILSIIKIESLSIIINCFLEIALFIGILFIYITKVLRKEISCFRINKQSMAFQFLLLAFILPAGVISFFVLFADGSMTFNNERLLTKIAFALKVGLSAGITEEVLFRGYIMTLIEKKWNHIIAFIAPSVLFASGHLIGGMGTVDVVQLFIAGITVGIMFSLVAYTFSSVNNSIVIHGIWNCIILGIVSISNTENDKLLFSYKFSSDEIWLTGGRFGVESSIPAIVGYLVVITIAILLIRKNKNLDSSALDAGSLL